MSEFEPKYPYPKSWSEMSFDLKLFYVAFLPVGMVPVCVGLFLPPVFVVVVAVILMGVVVFALVANRRTRGWAWGGTTVFRVLYGAFWLVAINTFIAYQSIDGPNATEGVKIAIHFAVSFFLLFWLLVHNRVLCVSRMEFEYYCRSPEARRRLERSAPPPVPRAPVKDLIGRVLLSVHGVAVFLVAANHMYEMQRQVPTVVSEQSRAIEETPTEDDAEFSESEPSQVAVPYVNEVSHFFVFGLISTVCVHYAIQFFVFDIRFYPGQPRFSDWRRQIPSRRQ